MPALPAIREALDCAVPAWMLRLSIDPAACPPLDGLPAADFAVIARFLASAALEPGGVTVLGRHWCAARHQCTCPAA